MGCNWVIVTMPLVSEAWIILPGSTWRKPTRPLTGAVKIFGAVLLTTAASQLSATELRAAASGTNLVLSWAQDSTNDFYIQVSTNLANPAG